MFVMWNDPLYRQTVYLVFGTMLVIGLGLFGLRNKNSQFQAGWASLKSWVFAAPVLVGLLGLSSPWPMIVLTILSIFCAKIFFQMTGMYHRSNFVWATYIGIILLGFCIELDLHSLYEVGPMIFLGFICFIPILRDSTKHMIQYLSLTLVAFSFLGWAFMHLGWLIKLDHGPYLVLYIIILTEVYDNMYIAISRRVGKIKIFHRINPKRNLESFLIACVLTFALAWAMRHLLPVRSEVFWMASAFVACFGGSLGDLTLSVIRRDLGIKDVGAFIIGRGDLLTVVDRLLFVAPIYYYVMSYLLNLYAQGRL